MFDIEDLPHSEQELNADQAKDVKGGLAATTYVRGVTGVTGDVNNDGMTDGITGTGAGGGPHVKG